MKPLLSIVASSALLLALAGCGSSDDDKLGTEAPPASPNAVAVPLKTDKNRPGSMHPSGGGAAPAASSVGHLRARPPGR